MPFDPHADLTPSVIMGLGWVYLILFAMNLWWAVRSYKRHNNIDWLESFVGHKIPSAAGWGFYSMLLALVAGAHFTLSDSPKEFLLRLPAGFRDAVNLIMADAVAYFAFTMILFALMFLLRKWIVKPTVGWVLLNASILFTAMSMTDYDFRQIVGKPDNVPIVSMLFIVGFFTWLYFKRAVDNDQRIEEGRPLFEQENNEKVLVWPDLVYTELICMIVLTVVLVAWGIALEAPLEEPANSAKTPNPSKAPWYFLGLQEMLVYFDPWLAGVVFPSLILVGLMAIPYIDFNKKGNGYFSFSERKFAIGTFMFGFMPLWLALIILGTFLRGPNWNIFGIYEYWDPHKLQPLTNINLSEYFWVKSAWGSGLPQVSADAGTTSQTVNILYREAPGFVAVLAYLFVLPPLLAATVFKKFFHRMGFNRYMVFSNLILLMAALPIKMVLRWAFNLKYIIAIPEWFFNI